MDSGLYTAASGLIAQLQRLNVISNNLANASTAGFKGDRTFAELVRGALAATPQGLPTPGTNDQVVLAGARFDLAPGPQQSTGRPLDLALEGDAFFAVQTPAGIRYTRHGAFQIRADGTLVTGDGYVVAGEDGRDIRLNPTGRSEVLVDGGGRVLQGDQEVGRLAIRDFPDAPARLRKEGTTLFAPVDPNDAGEISGAQLSQGVLEGSNVNVMREMIDLITAQRAFESYQKVIRAIDANLNERAVNQLGRLA